MSNDPRVVEALRRELTLPETVTDAEILAITKGSLLAARVELSLAMSDLVRAVKEAFKTGVGNG